MTTIPKKQRAEMEQDPFYHTCARNEALHDHECQGDPIRGAYGRMIEWEHALISKGRKVQKRFAIVPICWWSHRGPGLNKEINVWIALNRASDDELLELSRLGGRDYFRYRHYLNGKFGVYKVVENAGTSTGINYGYPVENSRVIPGPF